MNWPTDKRKLLDLGVERMKEVCVLNDLKVPSVTVIPSSEWNYSVCAYYRPHLGIMICLEKCQVPCTNVRGRNWTWPGSVTDREPYGVIAHELGHHMDWTASVRKGPYNGDYSVGLKLESAEPAISGYSVGDHEWFAEIARVFVTNPDLLRLLRPKAYSLLTERWKLPEVAKWKSVLGENVPSKVVQTLRNKINAVGTD